MKRFYFLLVIDTLFVWFSAFTISLVLARYFSNGKVAVSISILVGILFSMLFVKRRLRKTKKKHLIDADKKSMDETLLTINFMQKKEQVLLFETLLKKSNEKYEKKRDGFHLTEKRVFIYLSLGIDGATKKDVVSVYNKTPKDFTGVIVCTSISDSVLEFAQRFLGKIKIVDGKALFYHLKNALVLPKSTVSLLETKKSSPLFQNFFSKKKARNFFFLGIGFLVMSFFVSIKLYYIVFGTAFTIYSIACRFFAPDEQAKK